MQPRNHEKAEAGKDSSGRTRKDDQEHRCVIRDQVRTSHPLVFPIPMYGSESWTVKKRLRGKKRFIWNLALGESSADTLDLHKDALVGQSKLSLEHGWRQSDKTEAVLLWAHCDKAGFSGKDKNAGKTGGRGERKAKHGMDDSTKDARG